MDVHVANLCQAKLNLGSVKKAIQRILKNEKKDSSSINVVLCSDKKILELNRRFRQISKPTDVLSFPFNDSDLLGEIYVSVDMAERQAGQIGHSLQKEIQRLIVHGTMHLLGYDHKNKRDRVRMEAEELKYL